MKHIFTSLFIMLSVAVFAQSPNAFNYQGVARDNGGSVLANQAVSLRISILSGSPTGATEYSETHSVVTNDFGLFNVAIGTGSLVSGSFSTISWGADDHYTKVEFDPDGGPSYSNLGTSQLLSVPYAMYAESSGTGGPVGPAGPTGATGPSGAVGGTGASGSDGATGATGATGPLVSGNIKETLRYNGSAWVASNTLTNDGTNVGIGMSTPVEKLDVNGNIALRGSGRSILSPNAALNISSVSGIDVIIDDNDNSTNSTFKIKRNSDGVETIFEAKETGDVEVEGEYGYASSKTHYQSFAWSSFKSVYPETFEFGQSLNASVNEHYGVFSGTGTYLAYAETPIHLPDGAKIIEMKGWIYDNITDGLARLEIRSLTLGTDDAAPLASNIESDVPTASTSILEETVSTNITIDNSNKAYYLLFTGEVGSNDTRFYGARITYTVDQAD